jgi:Tn3 transposase DDE domain
VLQLFTDDRIEATTPFQEVQATAFGILPRPQLDFVATHIATTARCDETAFHWEYLDSPPLRQHVQRALNRGENYHQLRCAVADANFGKLRFRTEYEQHLWGECSRLLTNCIIVYTATLLSKLLALKERPGDQAGAAGLTRVAPVAWQHVNGYGRYEFRKLEAISMNAIVQALTHVPVPQDLAG